MKMVTSTPIGLAIYTSLVLASSSVVAQTYTVADVDSVSNTNAYAINDSGYVGGDTRGRASYSHAGFGVIGHSADIRSLRVGSFSTILDLNGGALGVGYTIWPSGAGFAQIETATLFTYDQRAINIGTLPGDTNSRALAVNDAGWVVGYSDGVGGEHPFLWVPEGGDITRPGTMYPLLCADINGAHATSINRDGLIGGYCGHKPYLWAYGGGYDISSWLPAQVDLGDGLVDTTSVSCSVSSIADSYAFSVNCSEPDPGARAGRHISFVSTPTRPALTQVPGFGLVLGRLNQVVINSINNSGCAVGYQLADAVGMSSYGTALKYCDGVLTNLNDVVVPGGEHLTRARDINKYGQILAQTENSSSGVQRAVVLTPL